MSYSNHTTNYNLPLYVGTDKPTYLGDFNTAMQAIDAQMKTNADGVTSASTSASTANTNIGTMANLTTTDKSSLVGAINELQTEVNTAQSTANTASSVATTANTTANGLASYLAINSFNKITNPSTTNGTISAHDIYVAKNSAGSLCKIYGYIGLISLTANPTVTLPSTGLSVSEEFTVQGTALFQGDTSKSIVGVNLKFKTNGNVEVSFSKPANDTSGFVRLLASVIFVSNFGDTPE